jgi:futalosine hydrolase
VVVATEIVPADLGIETEEGYLDPTALGFATAATSCDPDRVRALLDRLRAAGLPCRAGPVLTLSTMTGTDARATALYGRHRPIAEAMEGAGVAHVATWWDRPVLELRTMSNLVGRRDRERWRMDEALDTLSRAVAAGFADGAAR